MELFEHIFDLTFVNKECLHQMEHLVYSERIINEISRVQFIILLSNLYLKKKHQHQKSSCR